ncbi:protein RALF-like 19 [Primulina eburnea]|uniref:protein RALF-like 19 n=1 Tax=Primulina eburnea TaxID=1245227 RepID=UPI003C6C3B99
MAFRVGLVFLLAALAAIVVAAHSTEYAIDMGLNVETDGHGLVADALDLDEELMMESESARRQLAQSRYISYGALNRNTVPCNRRGASYYSSCRGHQRANPYRRGCTRATHCARNNR